jgi:peroxin-5
LLCRRGVLSEAALALEAEVTAHPNNAEAWRLLGTVHAENDDDLQVCVRRECVKKNANV